MERREGESEAYSEEHAPPPYYGDQQGPKMQVAAPLLTDNRYPQVQMQQMQPAMGGPRPGDQITVVTTAPKHGEEPDQGYGHCHLVCSFISVLLCTLFGLIALVMALLGYTDYRTNNYALYRSKRKCAIVWIILSWISAGIIIGIYFYISNKRQNEYYYDGYN